MSLLLGFGRGLQQGAAMLSSGMQEDRAVKRAEEIERMREASFERRWQRETAMRQSERAEDKAVRADELAKDMEWKKSESGRQAGQFDRQQSVREQQVIEGNITGILETQSKEEAAIQKKYEKMAELGGATPEMQAQMEQEITAVRQAYGSRLQSMIGSYGDKLRGTGYEYMLTVGNEQNNTTTETGGDTQAGQEKPRSAMLQDYIKQWASSKPTTQPPAGMPKPTTVSPDKAAFMPKTSLLDGVNSGEFKQFSSWMNQ